MVNIGTVHSLSLPRKYILTMSVVPSPCIQVVSKGGFSAGAPGARPLFERFERFNFENLDSITRINFTVMNMQCLQCVFNCLRFFCSSTFFMLVHAYGEIFTVFLRRDFRAFKWNFLKISPLKAMCNNVDCRKVYNIEWNFSKKIEPRMFRFVHANRVN